MLPIRVPGYDCRELRQLLRSREDYVNMRKVAKQRIKSLLLFAYLHTLLKDTTQYWSYLHIKRLKELPCSPATRQRLDLLLKDLDYARSQTLIIFKELKSFSDQNASLKRNIHYLRSIPGIGFITAITILASIGDIEQLHNPRELAAFTGLVPSEYSTGERISRGRITRWATLCLGLYWLRQHGQILAKMHACANSTTASVLNITRRLAHVRPLLR